MVDKELFWCEYEAWKFRLADNTFYTPDFVVIDANGNIECHEVKASWGGKPGFRDDARVKIKVAASRYPFFRWVAVWKDKGAGLNQWNTEEIKSDFIPKQEVPE